MSKRTKPTARKPFSFERCRAKMNKAEPWPPAHLALPDNIASIERGRGDGQRELFPEPVDDSRAARLARLTAREAPQGEGASYLCNRRAQDR